MRIKMQIIVQNIFSSEVKILNEFAQILSIKNLRSFVFLFLIFLSLKSNANNEVQKSETPGWVKKNGYSNTASSKENSGARFLLIDNQINLIKQCIYTHRVIKLLNSSGVQDYSTISVTFDPSYQKLHFHFLQIIRNGNVIEKLETANIELYQRETNMDRHLYDGALTAVINLSDVRQGDILCYSFSTTGLNPVNNGNFSKSFNLQYSVPASRIFHRIITTPANDFNFKIFNDGQQPEISRTDGLIEYLWDVDGTDFLICDNNLPDWYNPYKSIQISTFKSWKDVVDWAIPLYDFDNDEINKLASEFKTIDSEEATILEIIRFVQDEIRYLGFESGIGAYKPNKPSMVFARKYGDCKDKSLLLVALLQSEGFSAYPVYVNTFYQDEIRNFLPDNAAFNHCVVCLDYDGVNYFIDPTLSEQGGDLENISFPDYKYGLLIKPGQNELVKIPDGKYQKTTISVEIDIDTLGGDAKYYLRSVYSGSASDYLRSNFNSFSMDEIQKEYLNFYSSLYPDILSVEDVKFIDLHRNTTNVTVVEKQYLIRDFWTTNELKNALNIELYPLELENIVTYPKTSARSMPYSINQPFSFDYEIEVKLPLVIDIEELNNEIDGDGFAFNKTIKQKGKSVLAQYKYDVNKSYIDGSEVDSFLKKHEEIRNSLSYNLSYDLESIGFKFSWFTLLFIMSVVGLGVFLARLLYYHFDPFGDELATNISIGGWLILPAIGLIISPFIIIYQFGVWREIFDQQYWNNLQNLTDENTIGLKLLIGAEIAINLLVIIYSIVLTVLFFKRRTSVPGLMSIFYLVGIFVPVFDLVIMEYFFSEIFPTTDDKEYNEIGRAIIAAIVWVTYFNVSLRVKNTFCIRLAKDEITNEKHKELFPVDAINEELPSSKSGKDDGIQAVNLISDTNTSKKSE